MRRGLSDIGMYRTQEDKGNLECKFTLSYHHCRRWKSVGDFHHRQRNSRNNLWSDAIKQLNFCKSDLNAGNDRDPLAFGNLMTCPHERIINLTPSMEKEHTRKRCPYLIRPVLMSQMPRLSYLHGDTIARKKKQALSLLTRKWCIK